MKRLLFLGLDVDDKFYHGCGVDNTTGEVFEFKCKPNVGALASKLEKISKDKNIFRICYESTYLGFSLQRNLAKHGYNCEIIASSLIPSKPGDKVKTNRVDAKELQEYYSKGLLTPVYIPTKEEESMRDFLRSRNFLQNEIKKIKRHIQSLCRRMGMNYREEISKAEANYWTKPHRDWLNKKVKNSQTEEYMKLNLSLLLSQLEHLEDSVSIYDENIEEIAQKKEFVIPVKALCCYRGIKPLTALTLILELGDIRRFNHPKKLTSYSGLDLEESSSGDKIKKYRITKMGNKHIRTSVVESSQYAGNRPTISKALKERRKGVNEEFIRIADRCMNRLYKKSLKLYYLNKNNNKIKTACAREMLGFVWESLMLVEKNVNNNKKKIAA